MAASFNKSRTLNTLTTQTKALDKRLRGFNKYLGTVKGKRSPLDVAVMSGAYPVVQAAKRLAPQPGSRSLSKGTIRDRISRKYIKPGNRNPRLGAEVITKPRSQGRVGRDNPNDPFYWWWHEFGTVKMPARPFMRPAARSSRAAVQQAFNRRFTREMLKAIKPVKRKYPIPGERRT